jgi:hypothetical protein
MRRTAPLLSLRPMSASVISRRVVSQALRKPMQQPCAGVEVVPPPSPPAGSVGRCVLPPTERLRAAALLSVPHSPVEVISPFFVAPRERKQIELGIGEMAFILGDGQQLGRQLSVMISVQIGSRLICLL